jgi:asparagine synthase (glutamine-hydrolysing)
MPFAEWLRGPLQDVLDDTVNRHVASTRGLLDPNAVESVRERFQRHQTGWAEPWLLMIVELWCREVLDKTATNVRRRNEAVEALP